MNKPNETIARAISNLAGNHNWKEVVQWVSDSLNEQSLSMCSLRGEETIIMQGRCSELTNLLKHINNANNYLNNMRKGE